jgi:hypothetical protein
MAETKKFIKSLTAVSCTVLGEDDTHVTVLLNTTEFVDCKDCQKRHPINTVRVPREMFNAMQLLSNFRGRPRHGKN